MIKNFFLLAFRNFLKNKAFVIINVLGLGTALGCCIVAYLNYRFEADFNTMHTNFDKIYKINVKHGIKDHIQNYSISPVSLGPVMASEIPGIDRMVRYSRNYLSIRYQENEKDPKILIENIGFADKDMFRLFTFPMKWGDSTAFEDQSKILLSEKTSEKFFSNQNPIGKAITVYSEAGKGIELIIGGVFKEIPYNSIVRFDAITLYSNYISMYNIDEFDWKKWTAGTFIQISNPNRAGEIENMLVKYIDIQNKSMEEWKIDKYYIQSLKDFTKDSRNLWSNEVGTDQHPAQTITLIIMALLLLLLACFNYINTAIAVSNKRLKEIGVRKVVGSNRLSLVVQFMGENFMICFLALMASLLIGLYLANEYNKMLPFDMIENNFLTNVSVWKFLTVALIFTTLLSAAYPAFYISSFNPVKVLKGTVKFSGTDAFSRTLIVLQFSISFIGLVSSIAFAQNALYQKNFDFGYNKDQIITIPAGSHSNLEMLGKSLNKYPDILETIATSDHIPLITTNRNAKYIDQNLEVRLLNTFSEYCSFMDLTIVRGREFTREFETSDLNRSAIVNETLVKEFKWDDPIGKKIKIDTLNLAVVGVVKDYYKNLYDPIVPTVMRLVSKDQLNTLLIKGNKNKIRPLNDQIKKEWEKLIPYTIYEGVIGDKNYQYSLSDNKSTLKVFNFLSVVAVFLSLIALYTLVSLNLIKRTKEIGIRKVIGATTGNINYIFIKPFFYILLLASFAGGYGGYFLSQKLLSSVWKNHINITAAGVSLPIIALLILALCIMAFKINFTLWKNPINSLRYE